MTVMIISILFPILSLISLIVFIIVLIKQIKNGNALNKTIGVIEIVGFILPILAAVLAFKPTGIITIILGLIVIIAGLGWLWTFIWGWIRHKSLAMTNLMIIWTSTIVLPIILLAVFYGSIMAQMTKMVGDLAGDSSLIMKMAPQTAINPGLSKRDRSTNLPKRTIQKTPNATDKDWNAAAQALWQNGQYADPAKAKSYMDKAIAANPKMAESYNNRGLAFYNLERHQEAINDFSQAIRMKPQYAKAFNNRGNAYYALDQYQQAEADFNKSLQLRPRYAKAHLNRGLVYFQMKKIEESCNDFKRACDLGDCEGLQWTMQNGFCK